MPINNSSRGEVREVKMCGSGREIRLKGCVVAILSYSCPTPVLLEWTRGF